MISQNTTALDVFRSRDLRMPKARIAVLNLDGPLTAFFNKKNVQVEEFNTSTSKTTPVFVAGTSMKKDRNGKDLTGLFDFMRKGGTVIYIEGAQDAFEEENAIFPFTAKVHPAQGLWTCIPHLVHQHPVFEGLPVNAMMRNTYENIWPNRTLRNLEGADQQQIETLVASIGFDWFSREHKMHYTGPGKSWWGSDMAIIPYGDGRCFVSQLRLINNLDKDPVADKILGNIIRYFIK